MVLSQQTFPFTTAKYLNKAFFDDQNMDRRNSVYSLEQYEQDLYEKNDGTFVLIFLYFDVIFINNKKTYCLFLSVFFNFFLNLFIRF